MEPTQPKNQRKRKSQKPCTILKIKTYRKNQAFTRILNETLRDQRLGGLARGIIAYALSRPSDWKLHSWQVRQEFQRGEYAVRNAMKELVAAGYARLDLVRDGTGKVSGRAWLIRESSELEWPQPRRGFSTLGVSGAHRDVVFRGSKKPSLANCSHIRTNESYEQKSLTKKRVTRSASAHRVAVSLEKCNEGEREIVDFYNQTICANGSGWLPVNRFTPAVRDAIANWFASYRNTEQTDLPWLFRAVLEGNESITIPSTRTLVRLLYDNPPDTCQFPAD